MAIRQQKALINEKKIRRIMRKFHLKPMYLHRFRYHSDTRNRIAGNIKPDSLPRQFYQAEWVSDITYLIWQQKRAYLSTILDFQSRDIITFVISHCNDMKLVLIPCIKRSTRKMI
jgi:putative transposase